MTSRLLLPDDWPNIATYKIWLTNPIYHEYKTKTPFRNSIRDWCDKNCQGCYFVGFSFISFELEEDFVLAKLRFSDSIGALNR